MIGPEHPQYLELFYAGQSIPGRLMPRPVSPEPKPAPDPASPSCEPKEEPQVPAKGDDSERK